MEEMATRGTRGARPATGEVVRSGGLLEDSAQSWLSGL